MALWENSSDNLVSENDILGCNVSIIVREAAKNKIIANKISDAYWGIWLYNAGSCQIESNDIKSQRFGIWLLNSSAINVSQNKVRIENSASSIIARHKSRECQRDINCRAMKSMADAIGLLISEQQEQQTDG